MDFRNVKFDIIIQAGQSNAEGLGIGPVSEEHMPMLLGDVYYLEAEKTVEHLPETVRVTYVEKPFTITPAKERGSEHNPMGDFALAFGAKYEKEVLQNSDRKLLIIRAAIGGTGFVKKQWGLEDKVYLKMIEMADFALSLNAENRIVGVLWHQGECDSFEKNDPDVFKQQLASLIQDIRKRYGENIPFIAGDFVNEWKQKYLSDCEPIVEKIREVLREMGRSAFVETSDLLSNNQKNGNGDDIHFCREALYVLGRRYYDAFQEICNLIY